MVQKFVVQYLKPLGSTQLVMTSRSCGSMADKKRTKRQQERLKFGDNYLDVTSVLGYFIVLYQETNVTANIISRDAEDAIGRMDVMLHLATSDLKAF